MTGQPAAPHWAIPRRRLLDLSRTILARQQRSLRHDVEAMVDQLGERPRVYGLEHLPHAGPICLAANHYQRPDLWIGWAGSVITWSVGKVRSEDPPVHWLVIRESHAAIAGRSFELPLTAWLYDRVAHGWGMVPLPTGAEAVLGRVRSIRSISRYLQQGRVVGLFPEGSSGRAGPPGPAEPGAEALLRNLTMAGTPVVPVAVREIRSTLGVAFGPPLSPSDEVMGCLRRLYADLASC
jgi:1-acyl-sn-glycerol-3-phosphate acyltransferase